MRMVSSFGQKSVNKETNVKNVVVLAVSLNKLYTRQYSTILYLQVILRVPVRVKYNTGVSSSEVNTQAASTGTQQEDKTV